MRLGDLDTPALLLDIERCRSNLQRAVEAVANCTTKLRPHFKNHKCVELARLQRSLGHFAGMTTAKLSEAACLVDAGFTDILIANQVVGPRKIERLLDLTRRAQVRVAVDSAENVAELSTAARAERIELGVLIEIDVGMFRCGVPPGEPALELARRVHSAEGLRLDGLHAYEGHTVPIADWEERREACRHAHSRALETRGLLLAANLPAPILSGASTATFHFALENDPAQNQEANRVPGFDELQLGSYATMDWVYHPKTRGEFDIALSVLVTIQSVSEDRLVVDVGLKGIGADMGPPMVLGHPDWVIPFFPSEEHGVIIAPGHAHRPGDHLRLIPSHCCTTCNLHREIWVHEGDLVRERWPIDASGQYR